MTGPLVRLREVTREYRLGGQVVRALDSVSVDLEAGEIVTLMGASGSGKSTLLNVLGCLDRPTSGSYLLEGREVTTLPESGRVAIRRSKIGFIFQTFHLVPRLDALGNVELPMIFAGVAPAERRERARRSLESVGLAHRLEHRPDQLSGGERQRVAIARAVAMDPPMLLADEPTGNLDSVSGAEIVKLLRELNAAGRTILAVTHNPEVAAIGRRHFVMRDGRLHESR